MKEQLEPTRKSLREIPKIKHSDELTRLFHNDSPKIIHNGMHQLRTNPNIYIIDDWLSEKELLYLDKAITTEHSKFIQSTTEERHGGIVSSDRTSSSFHLTKDQDAICRGIERRAAELIGSHQFNCEPLQIVSYKEGQHFGLHHDAGTIDEYDHSSLMPSPVRLITLFGYLNNLPAGQGETEFPWHPQPLKVTPKRGRVLLFCNVNSDGSIDEKVAHKANPVSQGLVKYGINMWVCERSMQGYSGNLKSFCVGKKKYSSALYVAEEATIRFA